MNPTTSLYTLTVRLQTKTIKQIFIPGKTNKNRRSRTQKLVIFASKENTRSHETDTCAPYLTVYEHQLKHHDMASVRSLCLIKRIYSILFSHHLLSSIFPGKKKWTESLPEKWHNFYWQNKISTGYVASYKREKKDEDCQAKKEKMALNVDSCAEKETQQQSPHLYMTIWGCIL